MSKITVDQISELLAQAKGESPRVTRENLQAFLKNPDSVLKAESFEVLVDYSQSLEQMIKDGKYDWVNNEVTAENFPVKGKGKKKVKLELYQFGATVTGEEALKRLDEAGYRPATIEELLAFGRDNPDKQREFPIVALGQSWRDALGYLDVPYLYEDDDGRRLGLRWLERGFRSYCRFLVVGK